VRDCLIASRAGVQGHQIAGVICFEQD
jgi:hypothetical protein